VEVVGLSAQVRVVRDRWGVPHIYAGSRDDVFLAQGFVQAQDRLFQMDLWRRAAQGRLSEVLGANFIERDAMTRRLQYHGDLDPEWAAYGEDTRAIAEAFVRGINAAVAIARERTPELFRLAGWQPDVWDAADLLNRTDAFDREASVEAAETAGLPDAVVDAVRRAAVPPFFTGLAAPVAPPRDPDASSSASVAGHAGGEAYGNRPPPRALGNPSPFYLVHLHTPAWNAIGLTPPWRPGIAVGHDASSAWDRATPHLVAHVHAEPLDASGRSVADTIAVKGRSEPFAYETRVTARGVVIATDRESGRQFSLDWDGFRTGASPAFGPGGAPREQTNRSARGLVVFEHPLAITDAARRRFNIGPLSEPSGDVSPFQVRWDPNVWDASRAVSAPGQSEWRESPHYADLAAMWTRGQGLTLAYTDGAVTANAEATLILVPRPRR
jgi:penicillin amidase